jgi:hypothetical protein
MKPMRAVGRVAASLLLVLFASTGGAAATDAAVGQIDQVAAFARLYGVVRYFYPGDAAQTIDWDRLAVAGAADAQQATSRADLKKKLNALFAPLGAGIDIVPESSEFPSTHGDTKGQPLVAWRYLGFPSARSPYARQRTGRSGANHFVGLGGHLDATPLRGKLIRLRGGIRALAPSTTTGVGLWLRIDGQGKQPGFFENTEPRQKHDLAWHDYEISARVGAEASQLVFGATMKLANDAKHSAAGFRNFALEVDDGHGHWQPLPLPDLRNAEKRTGPWGLVGNVSTNTVTTTWHKAEDHDGYLVLQQNGSPAEKLLFDASPVPGKTAEFSLGAGLKARVALTLTDAQARPSPERADALAALQQRLAAMPAPNASPMSLATRQADIVVAWSTLRHFYPYSDVIPVDWNRELSMALADAGSADSRAAQKSVLQRLLVPLEDAHGTVVDMTMQSQASLPIAMAPIEQQWVVVATTVPDQARIGDVITSIDNVSMPQARERARSLASGQPSSLDWKALQNIQWGPSSTSHVFGLKHADGSTGTVSLGYNAKTVPKEARPAPVAELKPGIWYVDMARTDMSLLNANTARLASAHAVIYDMRGYPKDFGVSKAIPAHLLKHAEHAKWMHIPRYTGPFGEMDGYKDVGWDIQPAMPHFASRAIFLADGRTISQAEAIMGYVQDEKLGTIVGSTTRGVDGNITWFNVPGNFRVVFTGMKITHHDGVSRYHALGTPPDVTVQPSIAGMRAGRDEVLDAALTLAK